MEKKSSYRLAAADIESMAGTKKAHFLNPDARRRNKSLGDAVGLRNIGVHLVEVPPASISTELHKHYCEEEAVYVLAGHGTVQLDEETLPIAPGDFIGLPAAEGPAHAFHCTGQEPLKLLVIGQRLDADIADFPRLNKRLYRHASGWDLVDFSAIFDPKKANPNAGSK